MAENNETYTTVEFNVDGKILSGNIPTNLIELLYEDESLRSNVMVQLLESNRENIIDLETSLENPKMPETVPDDQNFKWSTQATKLLINIYHREYENFRNPKIKKRTLWSKVANEMSEHKYYVSKDACDKKLRNLKVTYRSIKDNASKTGRGRDSWEFFSSLDEIFCTDATVNPKNLISSMPLTSKNNSPVSPLTINVVSSNVSPVLPSEPSTSQSSLGSCAEVQSRGVKRKNRSLEDFRVKFLFHQKQQCQYLAEIKESIKKNVEVQERRTLILQKVLEELQKKS